MSVAALRYPTHLETKPWPWSLYPVAEPTYPIRVFAVDDDPLFLRNLKRLGDKHGISIDVFDPEIDFFNLPEDGTYDVAVIDYDLGHLSGPYICALYQKTPILLISSALKPKPEQDTWPPSVRKYSSKSGGLEAILLEAISLRQTA